MSQAPTWIGHTIGERYKIEELLGQGGMSAVYKATDPNLKRTVAIIIIHSHLSENPEFVRRFEQEAAAVAQLRHPNIMQVHDFDHDGVTYYIVFEYIPGQSLNQKLQDLRAAEQVMPLDEVIRIMTPLCNAVSYAHRQGMVHRDLKPSNVILNPAGQPILLDFGIAKILGDNYVHTATGATVGTAQYMAPEQVLGEKVDHRADIYSLGVMLYEMAAGRPPYEGNSAITVMMKHVNEPVPDARLFNADLPPVYNTILEKALAKNPNDRYDSANELAAALRDVSDAPAAPIAAASAASVTEVLSTPQAETAVDTTKPAGKPDPTPAATGAETAVVPPPPPASATTVETPPQAPPSTTAAPPPPIEPTGKKSRLPLYAGIAVVVILLLGIGGFFALRGNDDSRANELAEATAAPALPPAIQPTGEPTATEEVVVLPEPTEETATDIPEPTPEPTEEEATAVPTPTPTIEAPPNMTLIPAGSFLMGSPNGQPDEQPEHEVTLDAFFLDTFEVSNADYRECVAAGGCEQPVLTNAFTRQNYFNDPAYDNYPVIGVRWTHANAYCQWAGKRLPTEAEWEYAAAGPENFTWPWGNRFDPALSAAGSPDTQPVDAFPDGVSPFGIFNMAGSVNEWVQDTYDPNFYANSPAENPLNEAPGNRIYRGGSFANENGAFYTTSRRYNKSISTFDVDLGFRCAQDVSSE
ncbi:MAG TPA: hypothetical protein EYP41_22285 [Anaerolineae bacterium]|nr:hypothetical protein [Anaerolineae bacterium]